MQGLSLGLVAAALALSAPAWALLALTLCAGRRPSSAEEAPADNPGLRVAVLVPAHDESRNVLPTIACLLPQMRSGDRLVVIADNCSDDTAALAREAGAQVIERHHPDLRGKGYALACGVDFLRTDPPDVVMVVDADCTVTADAVARVASRCAETARPVQMLNLMHTAPSAGVRLRILEFAMVVKNLVRPLGAYRLGGACHLMGTGMALPWALMSSAQLATGHLAEDMKLGVDLALSGHPAQFYLDAEVSSAFPEDAQVARVQKSRWEHGHLTTLREELPRLLGAALRSRSAALGVLALDLLIPPLALYVMTLCLAFALAIGASLASSWFIPACVVLALGALALKWAVLLAWFRHGRHLLSTRELLTTPLYALWKLPVYVTYALRRRSGWVRTKRKSE